MKIFAGSSNPRLVKKIVIASDHAGFLLKEKVKKYLEGLGFQVSDFGCHSDSSCDYPDFAKPVSQSISDGEFDRGILICGTGVGMSIVANRFKNVRAVLCYTIKQAKLSRIHNDANVLCLGGWLISPQKVLKIIDVFLKTKFEDILRRRRRIQKIDN
ncbi:ribose 5-phosphate isomerase B [Candidatus Microgenomates bacterium]|nr:ribose 5-phosphate isomerase B [Candidatus Microgenomates bacterium]